MLQAINPPKVSDIGAKGVGVILYQDQGVLGIRDSADVEAGFSLIGDNGAYNFVNIAPGDYWLDVDKGSTDFNIPNYSLTSGNDPRFISIEAGEILHNINFGYSLSGGTTDPAPTTGTGGGSTTTAPAPTTGSGDNTTTAPAPTTGNGGSTTTAPAPTTGSGDNTTTAPAPTTGTGASTIIAPSTPTTAPAATTDTVEAVAPAYDATFIPDSYLDSTSLFIDNIQL
ncbi:Uncharacterised protein [Legionella busanensis]|uniref:SD-repeat containing protein B domain-containing protein n=1 Tax=Legionella busanensis TaxID=190655 RepID=A0A378JI99_9GAMM|nr:hypothetical protein [Legionella busanensis]STX51036.1 Uncharacterised protein [Legionella busanensis]